MSYEGYQEFLCELEHYHARDCNDDPPKTCNSKVSNGVCEKPMVWWNSVDQTNDECNPAKLEVEEEETHCTCKECGCKHILTDVRFKIPNDVGHKETPRSFIDWF